MTRGRRIISAIMLLAMIVSMIPAVPFASAATGVTYVLETGDIEYGAEYLFVSGTGTTAYALNGAGDAGVATQVSVQDGNTISLSSSDTDCLWVFEEGPNGTVYMKSGSTYLNIPTSSTSPLSYQGTHASLYVAQKTGKYGFYVKDGSYLYCIYFHTKNIKYQVSFTIGASNVYGYYLFKKASQVASTHTITFNGNGNTAGQVPSSATVKKGDEYVTPAAPDGFAKDGFLFSHWNDKQDGTGASYYPGKEINLTGDLTLYAQWIPIPKYQVTVTTKLDNQNTDLTTILGNDAQLHVSLDGTGHDHQLLTQTATGVYTIEVTENGTYSVYTMGQDGQHADTGKDVTIAGADGALELHYYSVIYDAAGGALHGTNKKEIYPAGTRVLAQAEPTRDGYEFAGWKDQNNTVIQAGGVVIESLNQAKILTAQWKKIEIDESLKTSYVIRYLEKGTYHQLQPNTTVTEAAAGHAIVAGMQAPNLSGYTYVGATINGVFIEKEKDPKMVLDQDASKNVLLLIYTPDPDLHLHKEATLENDGTYTIEMDMFIHENSITTLVQQTNPLDIVLVLDQSSSLHQAGIDDDLQRAVNLFVDQIANHGRENKVDHRLAIVGFANEGTSGAVGDGPVAGSFSNNQTVQDKKGKWVNTGVFDAHGDFHVKPIIGFAYEEYNKSLKLSDFADANGDPLENAVAYYTYADGEYVVLDYLKIYRHKITAHDAYNQYLNGTPIFGYVGGEFVELTQNTSNQWVLKANGQLYSFEEYFTAHHNVLTHRHGLEGREIHATLVGDTFVSMDGHQGIYTRKEVAEGQSYDPDKFKSIYADAMIPVTMGAEGSGYVDPAFKTAINHLGAAGETHLHYGMEMAYKVFEATPLVGEDRQRIVIVFTDGKPGNKSEFDEIKSNAALEWSAKLSNPNTEEGGSNALVYTIGLYGDDLKDGNVDLKDQQDFLDGLSSNFPTVKTMDEVWGKVDYIPAQEGFILNDGSPYYVKIDDVCYPLQSWGEHLGGVKYKIHWYYEVNGKKTDVITYPSDSVPKIGQNGSMKDIAGDDITIYRKYGIGYNEENRADTQYYYQMETAEQLEEYFATLVRDLTTKISKEINMTGDEILRDIMGQGLVLTPGTVITVYSEEGTFISAEKRVEWSGTRTYLDSLVVPQNAPDKITSNNSITVDGKQIPYISVYNLNAENPTDPNGANYHPHTVDIVGYDYDSDEWYLNADSPKGKRLIVTITRVEAQDNVIWGRAQTTNYQQSGLWLTADENGERYLLEAFVQPTTAFVERAYVLDYGKAFDLSGWYFDAEDGKPAQAIHLDFDLTDGMNYFEVPVKKNTAENNIQYGNVKIQDGKVTYQPTTTQWGGYDQFYVFGNTWRNTIVTLPANSNGNLWNKVTVIPANNIYYEDSFVIGTEDGVNEISGFVYTGDWTVENGNNPGQNVEQPEHLEDGTYGEIHGWTDELADDTQYSDGSAHVAFPNGFDKNTNNVAKAIFSFTGTGVDVYTRTNDASGMVLAMLTGKTAEGQAVAKSIIMDNLSVSGDYYQIPTISFAVPYGTYQVTLSATQVNNVAVEGKRYDYYLDGIRVYNPLGTVSQASNSTVKDAYGKELNAVFTEIRDIAINNNDFIPDLNNNGVTGAVFIDWIREGQESGDDVAGEATGTYEVATTFQTYGPKNEVYLTKDQAVVIKVDPKNTYYVGMKVINLGADVANATVNVSGLSMEAFKTITVAHSADLYYEVTPMDGYIVIENVSENGALLALTKLRTTNMLEAPNGNGVETVRAQEAVETMSLFAVQLEEAQNAPAPEPEVPAKQPSEILLEKNMQVADQLFTEVRTWLQEEPGGAA